MKFSCYSFSSQNCLTSRFDYFKNLIWMGFIDVLLRFGLFAESVQCGRHADPGIFISGCLKMTTMVMGSDYGRIGSIYANSRNTQESMMWLMIHDRARAE